MGVILPPATNLMFDKKGYMRSYSKIDYAKNKKAYVARQRVQNKKNLTVTYDTLNSIKRSNSCCDCKNYFNPECMDFDHVAGTKEFNVSEAVVALSLQKILDEVAKCQLVCANCHRKRTASRRLLPR